MVDVPTSCLFLPLSALNISSFEAGLPQLFGCFFPFFAFDAVADSDQNIVLLM